MNRSIFKMNSKKALEATAMFCLSTGKNRYRQMFTDVDRLNNMHEVTSYKMKSAVHKPVEKIYI